MCQNFLQFSRCFHRSCVAEQFRIANPKAKICVAPETRAGTRPDCTACITSVLEKRRDRRRLESLSAFEKFQLNQKLRLDQIRTGVSDKRRCGSRKSTSREQIIPQPNALAFSYRVGVHFHFRLAVLQRVLRGVRFVWKLPALANRYKSNSEFIGYGRSKNETARIDPDDFVNLSPAAALQKEID